MLLPGGMCYNLDPYTFEECITLAWAIVLGAVSQGGAGLDC